MKGRVRNNHFVFNKQRKIYFLLLANVYKDGKVRVGLLENDNLSVDGITTLIGTCLIRPTHKSSSSSGVYERLKKLI